MGVCQSRKDEAPKTLENAKKQEVQKEIEKKEQMDGQRREGKEALRPPALADTVGPPLRSYDEEAIARMRTQLNYDANAFLLNNILLSVQLFENYDRELVSLKKNPVSNSDVAFNEGLAQHYRHVYTPDKLQEVMHANVRFARRAEYGSDSISCPEALYNPKIFVVHDNIEASEPGDESDYSTVMDAPYYKMLIEDSEEPGYVKLRSLEILHNSIGNSPPVELSGDQQKETFNEQSNAIKVRETKTSYFDTSDSSDEDTDEPSEGRGETLLNELRHQLEKNLSQNKIQTRPEEFKTFKKDIKFKGFFKSSIDDKRENEILWKKLDNNVFIKLNNVEKESQSLSDEDREQSVRRNSGILKKSLISNFTFDSDLGGRRLSGVTKTLSAIAIKGTLINKGEFKSYKNQLSNSRTVNEDNDKFDKATNSPRTPSSGYNSDYGYSTITNATTPKPLDNQSLRRPKNTCKLPVKCLTSVEVKVDLLDVGDDEDELDESSFHNRLFKKIYYLNGTYFMENFVGLFIHKIGDVLGFSNDAISGATTQGASIYCDTSMNNSLVKCEIIPCVYAAWSCAANEWLIRQRRVIRNPRNNFTYQWPTPYMVQKARRLGCLLLPIGFRPARNTNPEQIYQWKISFASVERYLDLCLAHSQVRCYMFTLCLLKTYIEVDDCKLGLNADHIKAHLFTQCEDNYARWPEDRLGETLRIFLKSLYDRVMKSYLPCYFIPDCNLFKSIPKTMLLQIQRKIADILESPVSHTLMALQNLYYAKADFYPSLDYLKLYKILVSREEALIMLNPNLSLSRSSHMDIEDDDSDNEYRQREKSFWEQAKSYDREYVWQKEHRKEILARRTAESKEKSNKPMQFRIDPKVIIPNRLDPNKKRLILEFFIPHFIKMAEYSDRFEAYKQALIYLEHANRLCVLLSSEPSGEIQAQEYKDAIWEKFEKFKAQMAMSKDSKMLKRQSTLSTKFLTTPRLNGRLTDYSGSILNLNGDDPPPTPKKKTTLTISTVDIHGEFNFNKPQSFEPSSPFRLRHESESENETESKL